MKEFLKEYIRISRYTSIAFLLIWLSVSFVKWDIICPWNWIADIPSMEDVDRFILLFTWGCYIGIKYLAAKKIL